MKNVTLQIYGYPANHKDNFLELTEGIRLYQYGHTIKNRLRGIDHKTFTLSYQINT